MLKAVDKAGDLSKIILAVFAVLIFFCVAWLSVSRYLGFNAEMLDLGNMSQSIWSVARGKSLDFTSIDGPKNRLSKHAEFIFYLIAPIYRLFPSPITLLVLQAIIFVAGAIPLFRLARRRLGSANYALLLAVIYLLYPVGLAAVLFDFHGDTLAMALILFAIEALDRQSVREYLFWLTLSLSCKVYVAIPIIILGAVLWQQKRKKYAYLTWATSFIWIGFVLFVRYFLLPPDIILREGKTPLTYFNFYFGQLDLIFGSLLLRFLSLFIAVVPTLLLGIHALSWMAPGLLVAFAASISTGPNDAYKYTYHHYALAVPFLIAGLIYGVDSLQLRSGNNSKKNIFRTRFWKADIIFTVVMVGLFSFLFVPTPQSPLVRIYGGGNLNYRITSRDKFAEKWLEDNVPPAAPALADSYLTPHLANRETLYTNYYTDGPGYLQGEQLERVLGEVDYIVLDTLSVYSRLNPEMINTFFESPDFFLSAMGEGLVLFSRDSGSEIDYEVQSLPSTINPAPEAIFREGIELLNFEVEKSEKGYYRFRYDWMLQKSLRAMPNLYAITKIHGSEQIRIVHLSTAGILSTNSWPEGHLIREEFSLEIPEDGNHGGQSITLGLYDSNSSYLELMDARSRLGDEIQIGFLEVEE